MAPDVLTRLPALLDALDPAERPSDGLQLMSAERPFEPNPMVATVVHGLADGPTGDRVLAVLGLGLSSTQPLWLLRPDAEPERVTLAGLANRALDAELLYVPPIAPEAAERSLQGLRHLVHRLRAPGGCPWDREQTPESLIRFVIEEAYEVADAIRHEGPRERAEELGDLLLQVFLQAEIAEEAGQFSLNDVVEQISAKLIRRHPHVFGDVRVADAAEVERNWDRLKGTEKEGRTSALDGVPRSLPALLAAQEIQRRLKKAGFDWPDRVGVDEKLMEELAELREARTTEKVTAELGDLLFILSRLGLDLGADAEEALRGTNARVAGRFRHLEERVRERGSRVKDVPIEELLALWDEAKAAERA
jgi:tetrapyrrole methylase family protein / MazG family protein